MGTSGDGLRRRRHGLRAGGRRLLPVLAATAVAVIGAAPGTSRPARALATATVVGWGDNRYGQLGSDQPSMSAAPLPIPSLSSVGCPAGAPPQCSPFAGGQAHSLALTSDGTLWAWGQNSFDDYTYGQLGDGTTVSRSRPAPVAGLHSVVGLASKSEFSLAVLADGSVWGWGQDTSGQLGDVLTSDQVCGCSRVTPVQVRGHGGSGHLSHIVEVAAGTNFSLALDDHGQVWSWGANNEGQLGQGGSFVGNLPLPARVPGLPTVVAVAAGWSFSLALGSDGTVWAWGDGYYGQLGDGQALGFHNVSSPQRVLSLSGATAIAAGASHALALAGGHVWAWGENNGGQLGTLTCPASTQIACGSGLPILVPAVPTARAISAGGADSVALADSPATGSLWAWGDNSYGELGDNSTLPHLVPAAVPRLADVTAVGSGSYHELALVAPGSPPGGVTLTPPALRFGLQAVGTSSVAQSATLTNLDNSTISISGIRVTGDYTMSSGCGSSLASGQSCTIAVRFSPTATGARPGTLTVADNASNGSPQSVALTGAGSKPGALPPPPPVITSVDPDCGPVVGGEPVVVKGTGFVPGATVVTFDTSVQAPIGPASSTMLTVPAPAHSAITVSLTVTVGTQTSPPVGFSYALSCVPPVKVAAVKRPPAPDVHLASGIQPATHGGGILPLTPGSPPGSAGPVTATAPLQAPAPAPAPGHIAPPAAAPMSQATPVVDPLASSRPVAAARHAMVGARDAAVAAVEVTAAGAVGGLAWCAIRRRRMAVCRPAPRHAAW